MDNQTPQKISVQAQIETSVARVWELWTRPEHIVNWYFAAPSWHAPKAENDLRVGGRFLTCMEAKDGSMGFDYEGVYEELIPQQRIAYRLEDDRLVEITFSSQDNGCLIVETFDPELENPVDLQRGGWQAILTNFKSYAEQNK